MFLFLLLLLTVSINEQIVWVKLDQNYIRLDTEDFPPLPYEETEALKKALAPIAETKGHPTDRYTIVILLSSCN